ncbi:unnamed protein product, partial [Didymodactylos carnosus]
MARRGESGTCAQFEHRVLSSRLVSLLILQIIIKSFLKNDVLEVNDQQFDICTPFQETKTIRLLGIPSTVGVDVVRSFVSKWGTVMRIECETLPHPYRRIKTFVRRVRFTNEEAEQNVPISIKIAGLSISVHLEGRQDICYRCKGSGHIKKDCKVLKCRVCKRFGHDDPDCHVHASYANITRLDDVDDQVNDQDVNYEEQECSAGSHDTHMTPSKTDGSDCDHSGHGFNEPSTSLSCKSQPQPSPAYMQNTEIEPVTPPTIVEKNQ